MHWQCRVQIADGLYSKHNEDRCQKAEQKCLISVTANIDKSFLVYFIFIFLYWIKISKIKRNYFCLGLTSAWHMACVANHVVLGGVKKKMLNLKGIFLLLVSRTGPPARFVWYNCCRWINPISQVQIHHMEAKVPFWCIRKNTVSEVDVNVMWIQG